MAYFECLRTCSCEDGLNKSGCNGGRGNCTTKDTICTPTLMLFFLRVV